MPSQPCYEASWTQWKISPSPCRGDFEGCHGCPGPVRIEVWITSFQRVPIIWYALSVNLHELCTQCVVGCGTRPLPNFRVYF